MSVDFRHHSFCEHCRGSLSKEDVLAGVGSCYECWHELIMKEREAMYYRNKELSINFIRREV